MIDTSLSLLEQKHFLHVMISGRDKIYLEIYGKKQNHVIHIKYAICNKNS